MFTICALLKNWAGLCSMDARGAMKSCAEQLAMKALEVQGARRVTGQTTSMLLITDG